MLSPITNGLQKLEQNINFLFQKYMKNLQLKKQINFSFEYTLFYREKLSKFIDFKNLLFNLFLFFFVIIIFLIITIYSNSLYQFIQEHFQQGLNGFTILPKFYNIHLNIEQMGGAITIDKHTTQINQWFSIQNKLDEISFEAQITNHLSIWKICNDPNNQNIQTLPVDLSETLIFQDTEAYIISLVVNKQFEHLKGINYQIKQTLVSITRNIKKSSYQTYIKKGQIGQYVYFTYAFLGNECRSAVKITAINYAIRLAKVLNSDKKLKILSGGGVCKNKKLQIGSLLYYCENMYEDQSYLIAQFASIHIVKSLIKMNWNNKLSIFKLKSRNNHPNFFYNEKPNDQKNNNPEIPSLKINNKTQNKTQNKPPSLKLDLKPYEEITYEQIQEEQNEGTLKFDIRATARHQLQMEKFSQDCTKIIDGLYVSGDKVASNLQILKEFAITDIVNCAGDYCDNYFQKSQKLNYLTFFLKDSQIQNIQCLFYRVIDFINNAHRNKRSVLVHCIQGISRSVSFVIAYLIFMNGFDYKKAENFVKSRRKIACPNNGFMVQLIQFHKRLYQKYQSLNIPRVFLVSSHCSQTPKIITARLLKYPLFDKKKFIGLDTRGMYIIHCPDIIYLWVGSKCEAQQQLKEYWQFSQNYIKTLQEHEKAPMKVKAVSEKNQGKQFLNLWNLEQIPYETTYQQYNKLFVNINNEPAKPGNLKKYYQHDDMQSQSKQKLFIYPDYKNGLGVFDYDDLTSYSLIVKIRDENIIVFIWKSQDWVSDDQVEQSFIKKVVDSHYDNYERQKIKIKEEDIENPSEEFLDCVS